MVSGNGEMLSESSIWELRAKSCAELMRQALQIKLAKRGNKVALCSIVNAKSGQCSEDCRFCVQSAHYKTDSPIYPLKGKSEIFQAAREACDAGAEHFSLVTSGRGLSPKGVEQVAETIFEIKQKFPINVCASLGILERKDFVVLKEAGLTRYHHNLETSKEFFPQIVTTHTFQDRIDTIKAGQAEGIEICSGGIFGLGETEDDRISMAISLREMKVESVPINILIPLAGTPLEKQTPLAAIDILRAIAIYRIAMPDVPIRLAAGRESALQDFLSSAFLAGADGMMIGGYLTKRGRSPEKDIEFVREIKKIWQSC